MKIRQLIESLDTRLRRSSQGILLDLEAKGISCDSRDVRDGFVFVAIRGNRQDGNKFINEAIDRGASTVVVQGNGFRLRTQDKKINLIKVASARTALAKLAAEFYGNPSLGLKVVGVTGTNGKTTITYLLEALLKEAGLSGAVIGTINYRFTDKVVTAKNTTPGPVELESLLAKMLMEGCRYCFMEVSSHALDQARTEGINFSSAIFTNLTQDHLDYHKTKERYFNAKARLFKNISGEAFAVINNDDKYGHRLKKLTRAKVVTYGLEHKSDVSAKNIRFDSQHTLFRLVSPQGEMEIRSSLIGKHNIYNVLAVFAWAQAEGIDLALVKSSLQSFSAIPGRLERIDFEGDFSVFVDYAHTEDALRNVLLTLRPLTAGKIITVFGCGGERDRTKRPKMGRVVSGLADYAIITNDNPRSEDPYSIIADIKKGIKKANFSVIPDRFLAIKKSLSLAKSGDIVLVAGKGHEDYQILKNKVVHFDDREAVRECLSSMNY